MFWVFLTTNGFSSNTCISYLMVLWTFWEHAEDYEVAEFCFSSDNFFLNSADVYSISPNIINPHLKETTVDLQFYVQTTWPIILTFITRNQAQITNLRSYVCMQLHLDAPTKWHFKIKATQDFPVQCSTINMVMLCTLCYPLTPSLFQEESINIISLR